MSQAVNNTLSRLTNLALEVDDDFWFCLTDLFIQRLLQVRAGPPKTLGFFRQDFSQARCSSCHPATSVEAHEHSTTRSVRRLLFVYPCLFVCKVHSSPQLSIVPQQFPLYHYSAILYQQSWHITKQEELRRMSFLLSLDIHVKLSCSPATTYRLSYSFADKLLLVLLNTVALIVRLCISTGLAPSIRRPTGSNTAMN